MKILTRTADAVKRLRLPVLKTRARGLVPALLIAATLPLSSPAQTLPVTSGLQLWLKADAGVTTNSSGLVTAWADQSGLGNNATQTNPAAAPSLQLNAQNGKPTIRYKGDTRYLDVADSSSMSGLAEDVTILEVLLYDDLTGGYRTGIAKVKSNYPAPFDTYNYASWSGGRNNFLLAGGPGTPLASNLSLVAPPTGIYFLQGFSWANGITGQYLNNLDNGQGTYANSPADGGGPLRLGSRDDLVTQLQGNIAELLIYQPALSDAQRTAVISYLQTKWKLNFVQPPTVSLQTPTNGVTAAAQATVAVAIQASDPNTGGVVTLVTLRDNGTPVATWTQPPYSVNLSLLNPGQAVLTAVAANNLGASATSAPVSITVTGAAPTLAVTNGLKVWLRADAGVMTNASGLVTNWTDQSGNGNNAVQADTTVAPLWLANAINGEPALAFGSNALSNNQLLQISDAGTAFTASSNFTILVEAQFTDFASYRTLVCKTALGVAAPLDWWFAPNTGVANGYLGDGSTFCTVAATTAAMAGQFTTFGLEADGTNLSHLLNFAQDGTGPINATSASTGNPLRIGQRDDMVTQMVGDISEILMYDRALSAGDQSNAVIYLSSKVGLAQAAISDVPPTVSITSPTSGGTFAVGTNIQVVVSASSPAYTIQDVLLLANGTPVVTPLTNSPYEVWINLPSPGTVSLTAVAVDNFGVASTSAPVALTVTGTGLSAPPTNDLRVWFSADVGVQTSGGSVSQWNDRSGNGNTATAGSTSPTLVANALNGKPVLHFVAPQYLDVPTAPSLEITGDMATYVVVRFADFSSYRALWTKTKSNIPASFDWWAAPNTGVPNFYRGNGTAFGSASGTAIPAGAYVIVGYEMAGTTASHYLNGGNTASGTINVALADGGTDALIGSRNDFATTLDGDIAELLCFGHGLAAEREQVLSYLGGKYGLVTVTPAVLPPTVTIVSPTNGATAGVSNSISVRVNVTDPYYPVTQVNFLANGAVIASEANAPYSISLDLLTPGAVTLEVQAVDIWGTVGASAPAVLTITGQGAAAPPTNGLVLWLKADKGVTTNADGTVAAWADQSGLGNKAVQTTSTTAPTLGVSTNGKPVLEFSGGSSQFLVVSNAASIVIPGDISTFCAFNVADVATEHMLWSKSVNGVAFPWTYYTIASSGDLAFGRGGTSCGVAAVGSTVGVQPGVQAVTGAVIQGSLEYHYFDGAANVSGILGCGAVDGGTNLVIGADDLLANQFAGTLSELMIYDRALTGDDLLAANAYLAARNGIVLVQAVAPSPSPSPTLTITRPTATTVELSWPTSFTGFVLESATSLASPVWTPVATNPPNNQFIVGTTNVTQFFRLQSQ